MNRIIHRQGSLAIASLVSAILLVGCDGVGQASSKQSNAPDPPPEITLDVNETSSLRLIYIQPGKFKMGRNISLTEDVISSLMFEADDLDEQPARKIRITKGYYIGRHKVTVAEFCSFLNTTDDAASYISLNDFARVEIMDGRYAPKQGCDDCSISTVTWEGANAFCEWLSDKTGFRVRLPTEAEWEFAARGSEGRRVPWGDNHFPGPFANGLEDKQAYPYLWSCDPVGTYSSNITPEGVLEMADWIGDWCSDLYVDSYDKKDKVDPKGPSVSSIDGEYFGDFHVLRRCIPFTTQRTAGEVGPVSDGVFGLRVVAEVPSRSK